MNNDFIIIFFIICVLILLYIYFNETPPQKKEPELIVSEPIDKNVIQAINITKTVETSPLLS
jgi:hypothetical protein